MDFSNDDYFGTLGQGLMKDLLADLQVEDGDWSLDQLEKELAQLDQEPPQQPQLQQQNLPTLDAASLVVMHAQERTGGGGQGLSATPGALNNGMDAWSLSLEKFTALSLSDDFLAADSVRKQRQHPHSVPSPQIAPGTLEGAEDYDIAEKPALAPPPGLGRSPSPVAPKTPQNSLSITKEGTSALRRQIFPPQGAPQSIPANFVPFPPQQAGPSSKALAPPPGAQGFPHPQQPVSMQPPLIPPGVIPPQGEVVHGISNVAAPLRPPMQAPPGVHPGVPPQGVFLPMPPPQGPSGQPVPMSLPQGPPGQPIIMAMPAGGPAWQAPPRAPVPVPPPIKAFCNPHPNAPPVPATALETKFMTSRDIAYVVHAIMKPVLAAGVSQDDYHMQFLRRSGTQANPAIPKHSKDMIKESVSRTQKSKEWSSEKSVLGHVAKSNVARPRALIATPQSSSEQDSEQKQRASLWKARIYCDQAYQSYQMIVDIWRTAPPGGVPPQLQSHLVKLMKCMGITHVEKEYQVDTEALKLLTKLNKGRTLLSRILEQALLPPNAVQNLLPAFLQVLLPSSTSKRGDSSNNMATERLFRAITGVIKKLNTSSVTLLRCLDIVQAIGKEALSSTARMECVHTLLQKGSIVIGQDPSAENRTAWGKAESEFMLLLQAY
jgi:hypothetical protein